jgi:molybdate transport system substrate-binding protein
MKRKTFSGVLALLLAFSLQFRAAGEELLGFAAASLSESLTEIAIHYEKRTGDGVKFSFGASSLLARQIEEGAPADFFFSADEAKMDSLEKKGLIQKDTRKSHLSNSLVIVVAADSSLELRGVADLAGPKVKRLALAEPSTVPAGIYARQYLEKRKAWASVESKVVPTENVRAALAAVESGNVEAGIVYKTDAAISKRVKISYEVPANEGPKISYPIAAIQDSRHAAATRRFLKFLQTEEASAVFRKHGFIVQD